MEIKQISWPEGFCETCQDIVEDAFLLDALAVYAASDGYFMQGERVEYFPQVFGRLCGYLSQHTSDLCCLEKRLGLGNSERLPL